MNAFSTKLNRANRTRRWFRLGQFACSAIAALSLVFAVPSSWRSALIGASAPSKAVAATQAVPPTGTESKPQIAPIQDIQLGERLAGRNPLREQVELEEPDQESWRAVSLQMHKANGLRLCVELLRPLEWLAEYDADVGSTIFLDLEEMGAVGDAEVTAIEPCPPIEPGDGAVVTGKFKHETDGKNVVLLTIEGQAEPTGVTSNHPYWSVDRQDFVPAGQLREGELLVTEFGPRRVLSLTPTPNYTGLLYNLETTEHVYEVGSLGELVHNDCPRGQWVRDRTGTFWSKYQGQVTGKYGKQYKFNDVKFDGYKNQTLIEAKGIGYKNILNGRKFGPEGRDVTRQKLLEQADRQVEAAKGTGRRVRWVFAEREAAEMMREALENKGIEVVHQAMKFD